MTPQSRTTRWWLAPVAAILLLFLSARPAEAYIGPGAGFAVLSSFFVLFTTIVVVTLSLLAWPFRAVWRLATGTRPPRAAIRRLIVVGFDGQDPKLTDQFMAEGRLPHFKQLAEMGCARTLRTTFPSISPVAWSSFSTGCDPARHNIYDFIEPDRRTYLPRLTSTRVGGIDRFFNIGRYRIPREKPELRLLRKSKPFWTILGEHRIWSTILRVPITFPPDRFYGAQLSAMCVPDLLGTQGTFRLFTTRPGGEAFVEGGTRVQLPTGLNEIDTTIEGPENLFREGSPAVALPLRLTIDRTRRVVRADLDGASVQLTPGTMSDWISLRFHMAPGINVHGLARLLVTELGGEHVSVYMTPINLDPERPAMPISHPPFYATYLAKRTGPYSTLGLAEDTWALNEGVIDDDAFLKQTYDIDHERERMFNAALDRLHRGSLVCVFDATDRIQHMFWRDIDPGHPAARGSEGPPRHAIRDLYEHNDALLGRVMQQIGKDDVLMVISDHGFNAFRRGINLNAWLHEAGYLALKPGASGGAEWLRDVDWAATKAYCVGLTGMFLNLQGREQQGIVQPGADALALKAEIIARLTGMRDPDNGGVGIREAFDTAALYKGPYLDNAPDILIGYNAGYRASWDGARGVVSGPVFQDNIKAWSGDHCIDPRLVPGVFYCNRHTATEDPALIDIAPTALRLFGIEPPAYMDGRPLMGLP